MTLRAGQEGVVSWHCLISKPCASIGSHGLNRRLWQVLVKAHPAVRSGTVIVDGAR